MPGVRAPGRAVRVFDAGELRGSHRRWNVKEIHLYRGVDGWVAYFYQGGEPDEEVVHSFGTHGLPTPFTNQAPASRVLAQIQSLNPDAIVRLRDEGEVVRQKAL